ncbi:MAG: hypothetical protein WC655_01980 [Candidatus Hydrogenedentales bacterium]
MSTSHFVNLWILAYFLDAILIEYSMALRDKPYGLKKPIVVLAVPGLQVVQFFQRWRLAVKHQYPDSVCVFPPLVNILKIMQFDSHVNLYVYVCAFAAVRSQLPNAM